MCYTAETSVLATKRSFANIRYAMPRGYLPWGLRCFLQHPYCAPTAGGTNLRYTAPFLYRSFPIDHFRGNRRIFYYNNSNNFSLSFFFFFLFIYSLQSKKRIQYFSFFRVAKIFVWCLNNLWISIYELCKFQIFRTKVIIITYL